MTKTAKVGSGLTAAGRRLLARRPTGGIMVGLAVAATLLLWSGIGLSLRAEYRAAGEAALRDTANMARTLEAQIAGRIEAIDARLRFAQALYARDPAGFAFGAWAGIDPAGDIPVGYVIGLDGFARVGRDGPVQDGIDRSGMPYLRAHLDHPGEDRLQIGAPFEGRVAQRQVIVFSRPLRGPDGALAGAVIFGVDAASLSRLYQALDLGEGVIFLAGFDGVVRAWAPNPGAVVGFSLPEATIAPFRDGTVQISQRMTSVVDGMDRFVTLRRVEDQPLIVSVGLPAAAVLAGFRADLDWQLLLGGLLTLLVGAVCGVLALKRRAAGRAQAALEAAIGHISQGIMMVDPGGRVVLANARAIELLGLPAGLAVPGRPMRAIIDWQAAAGEFGAGPPPETRYRSLAAAPGAPPDLHERTRPNGTVLEIRTEHLPDGSHVRTYTDLTAARRTAQSIAEARDRAVAAEAALAAAIEHVPHGVLMVGADNRVLLLTRRAIEMLELPPELTRPGTDVRALFRLQVARGDLATAPGIGDRTRMALADRPAAIPTYERELRNGRVMEVRSTLLPDGRAVRTYTDVTERRTAARAQEAAQAAAEANIRARTEFLAMVSHELRTPLNAVIGLSGLVLEQGLPESQATNLRLIREAGDHLLALVNDILDVTRLDRGQMPLQEEPFDIRQTLRAAVEMLLPQAEAKGLALEFRVAEAVPAWAVGDAGRLRQVVLNLLGNAVKFTETGRIALTVTEDAPPENPPPGAPQKPEDGRAELRLGLAVADTGIGIAPEVQARLFDAFVQADSGTSRRHGGAGLGLAICRLLLERMGGRIDVESAPGAGSTFRCVVPLRRAAPVVLPPLPPEPCGLQVLVAEDILANQVLLTHHLTRLGHAVDAVANGAEAVAAVQARRYDLLIMDVMMPVMDGMAAARAIRALDGPESRIPIIALTAHGSVETEAEGLAAGIDRFEMKPLGPDALRAAVAAVMEAAAAV